VAEAEPSHLGALLPEVDDISGVRPELLKVKADLEREPGKPILNWSCLPSRTDI
jgi:hypothetical protein